MKAQTALERTKQAWRKQWEEENLDVDVRRLINQATFDLWYGPGVGDDDDDAPKYPGFETACDKIKQPDDTTHVCHPAIGGCNWGFELEFRVRVVDLPESAERGKPS